MRKSTVAFLLAGLTVAGSAPSAHASIVYDLTFYNYSNVEEGTGVLTLNYSTLAQAENVNTSSTAVFTSLVTTNINSDGSFTLTPSSLSGFQLGTNANGTINTLTLQQIEPTTDGNGTGNIPFLDVYTSSWAINGKYDSPIRQGSFTISAPSVETSTAPLPSSLPLFAGGLGVLGLIGFCATRRKQNA